MTALPLIAIILTVAVGVGPVVEELLEASHWPVFEQAPRA